MAKPIPYPFVLEALERAKPYTKPMFGCLAVYVGEKMVLVLRDKPEPPEDKGVWLSTTLEHHESLRKEFPRMRSLTLFGPEPTGSQVLGEREPDFEEAVLRACELIVKGDPRIGRIPKKRRPKVKATAAAAGKKKGAAKRAPVKKKKR